MPLSRWSLVVSLLLVPVAGHLAALPLEIPVATPVYGEAFGYQFYPCVASDGDGYLAVWYDGRSGFQSLIATRLTSSGEVLDENGIALVRESNTHLPPKVVWSGTSYVVFWRSGASVMSARVDREGRVQGAPRVVAVNANTSDVNANAVASNGSRIVVSYASYSGGSSNPEIRAAILDADANVLADIRLAGAELNRSSPSVAAARDEFVVVWERNTEWPPAIEGVRISGAGALLDATPRTVGSGETPVIASDGHDYVVVSYRSLPVITWVSRRVAADLSGVFPEHDISAGLRPPVVPLWTGTRYDVFAIDESYREVLRFSMDSDGRPSAVTREETTGSGWFDAATNGRTVLRTWTEGRDPYSPAIMGTIGDTARVLSLSANDQRSPKVAYGGGIELVAWREESGVYATRIAPDGRSLDGRGIPLALIPNAGAPTVVFDGNQFVVAWRWSARAMVRFVSPVDGLLPGSLEIDATSADPALAPGGEGSLFTWTEGGGWTEDASVRAVTISRVTRAIHGTPVVVASRTLEPFERISRPEAVWNGSEFLIAWSEYLDTTIPPHHGSKFYRRIRGGRLNANLTLLDTEPLLLGDAEGDGDREPRLVSDGSDWLLVWRSFDDLRARRIARNGTPQGSVDGVSIGTGFAQELAWDGNRYLVAWKALPQYSADPDERREIRYGFLPRAGMLGVIETSSVAPTFNTDSISVATTQRGRFTIAYSRIAYEPENGGVPRAFVQRLGAPAKRRATR